jgi:hypothetical protein
MSDDASSSPEIIVNQEYEYGRLWPDGTFNRIGWSNEKSARKEMAEKSYELKGVPESLRPVFGRRKVVKTTEIHPAEALPEPTA